MNADITAGKLRLKYGEGKNITQTPEDSPEPTEMVCEIEPTAEHRRFSIAVAVIESSAPHHHERSTETYRVLSGMLLVDLIEPGKKPRSLKLVPGRPAEIKPNTVHSARSEGRPAWVEVTSRPGWTEEDHILDRVPEDEL